MRNALGGKPAGMWAGVTFMVLFAFAMGSAAMVQYAYAATGSVTVTVAVSGGSAHPSDFKLTMKKKGSNSGVIGSGNTVTFSAVPGTYVISSANPSRYSATWGGDCNSKGEVVIIDGAAKKCTLTAVYGSNSSSSNESTTSSNPRTVRSR